MALSAKTIEQLGKAAESRRKRPQDKVVRPAAPPPPEAVNDHAAQHGIYERDGNRGTINRGGTPIARWRRESMLSESQLAAIELCLRLWERAGRHTGLVMDLTKTIGQPPSSGWSQQEALDELASFKKRIPRIYWDVFENVCRFDLPAGVAGSELATNSRSAVDRAFTCVCFTADLIATWKRL